MRFLVDQPVSWQVAVELASAGHDAVHVRQIGLSSASDETILERASTESRVVVTQDTDFGMLLARTGVKHPSIILLRTRDARPINHARAILEVAISVEKDLHEGAIVVIGDESVRIRRLPVT